MLSVPGKVLALILLERLQAIIDPQLMEAQCGFRKGRGTVDQIWVMRQVVEKATEYRTPVFLCFVDLTKAYDSVNRQAMVAILREYGVPHQLVEIIEELHSETWSPGLCTVTIALQLLHGQDPEGGNDNTQRRPED